MHTNAISAFFRQQTWRKKIIVKYNTTSRYYIVSLHRGRLRTKRGLIKYFSWYPVSLATRKNRKKSHTHKHWQEKWSKWISANDKGHILCAAAQKWVTWCKKRSRCDCIYFIWKSWVFFDCCCCCCSFGNRWSRPKISRRYATMFSFPK